VGRREEKKVGGRERRGKEGRKEGKFTFLKWLLWVFFIQLQPLSFICVCLYVGRHICNITLHHLYALFKIKLITIFFTEFVLPFIRYVLSDIA
jgi:hypothetical protein